MGELIKFPVSNGNSKKNDISNDMIKELVSDINNNGRGPLIKEKDIIKCSNCGSIFYIQSIILGKVVSADLRHGIAQIAGPYICVQCGKVIEDELKSDNTSSIITP